MLAQPWLSLTLRHLSEHTVAMTATASDNSLNDLYIDGAVEHDDEQAVLASSGLMPHRDIFAGFGVVLQQP